MRTSSFREALRLAADRGDCSRLRSLAGRLDVEEASEAGAGLDGVELLVFFRVLPAWLRWQVAREWTPDTLRRLRAAAAELHEAAAELNLALPGPAPGGRGGLSRSLVRGAALPRAKLAQWRDELAAVAFAEDIRGLFVLDEAGRPCGWIPVLAFVEEIPRIEPAGPSLRMSACPVAAYGLLRDGAWPALPVVSLAGRYLGCVTPGRLARCLLEETASAPCWRDGVFWQLRRPAVQWAVSLLAGLAIWSYLMR